MTDVSDDELNLGEAELQALFEARAKAQAIVDQLERQRAQTEAAPPDLPPAQLAAGRAALLQALQSARRMLENLEAAIALVTGPTH